MKKVFILSLFFLLSSLTFAFAAAPVIFYSDLTSGPNTGGQNNKGLFVTIWGKNFGTTKGTNYVSIGGGQADNYLVWSDTKISFQLGANAATGNIIVSTSGGTSNGVPFTVRSGNIYFVSASSPNNPGTGTYADPWRSPASYYNALTAGDICYFRQGTYGPAEYGKGGWHSVVCIDASKGGTASNPVAWVGYPGETALFQAKTDGTDPAEGFRSSNAACGYVTIANLSVNAKTLGIENTEGNGGPGWRIVGNKVSGGAQYAHIQSGGNGVKVLGNECFGGYGSNLEHSIYISFGSLNFEVGWNYLHDNVGSDSSHQWGYEISIHTDNSHAAGFVFTGTVHDNLITTTTPHQSRGINVGETGDGSAIDIYNNLVYHCGGYYNAMNFYSGNLRIYNNTFYDIDTTILIYDGQPQHSYQYRASGEIKNNIFYSTGNPYIGAVDGASLADMTISNNCYFGNGSGPTQDTHPINTDPKFVNRTTADFHLQSTSPCIDAGYNASAVLTKDLDGITRPQGSAFDMGAYEYASGSASVLYGDVSGDGTISGYDASLVAQHSAGLLTLTAAQQKAADVSGDGSISAYDASLIAQYSAGLITKFPVQP